MAEYRLHCFAQSGNAYRAALMLELCGADWEPVFVDFFAGATRSPEFRQLNEMGEVPVLEFRKQVMTQSPVMLDFLSRRFDRFRPDSGIDRREVQRWMFWDVHKLTGNLATYRFMLAFLPEEKRNAEVIGFLGGRTMSALKVLEGHLQGRDWIVGSAASIADLCCVGYFYYGEEWGFDPAAFPNIAAWRDRIAALPGWKHPYDLMPGHPLPGAG